MAVLGRCDTLVEFVFHTFHYLTNMIVYNICDVKQVITIYCNTLQPSLRVGYLYLFDVPGGNMFKLWRRKTMSEVVRL